MSASRRIRVDFTVREILESGDEGEPRGIVFGDDVSVHAIKDFFQRCGLATDMLFRGTTQPQVIRFSSNPANKINAIKVLRQLAVLSLREAKDIVEQPVGTPLISFDNPADAETCLRAFTNNGVKEVETAAVSDTKDVPKFQRVQPVFAG